MLVFVATALAGTVIGWPCQRLNWGWRNVWSTCSINSYIPQSAVEATGTPPLTGGPNTGYRTSNVASGATGLSPTFVLDKTTGVYTPNGPNGNTAAGQAVPAFFCANALATGSGAGAALRNRCRRAIDAYGALVKTCASPVTAPRATGAAGLTPDFAPSAGHGPHLANVRGLTENAMQCMLPAGLNTPAMIGTPSNTCPGLLGWFTVVYNVCGFTNAPGLQAPNQATPLLAAANTPYYFPANGVGGINANFLPTGAVNGAGAAGTGAASWFCQPAGNAGMWNVAGAVFRTSRCRKALDQFGRTAARCHMSDTTTTGPAQAGGYSDPLRLLAVGNVGPRLPAGPTGMNVWAPACNV